MSKKKHAGGRPKQLDGELVLVTFKADKETIAALDELCAAYAEERRGLGEIANGGRAQAIRRSIRETAARRRGAA
jgi:hypothetical protein